MPKTTVRWEKKFYIVVEKSNHNPPMYKAYYADDNAFAVRLSDNSHRGIGDDAKEAIEELITKLPRD